MNVDELFNHGLHNM